jgi:hypothetical protein
VSVEELEEEVSWFPAVVSVKRLLCDPIFTDLKFESENDVVDAEGECGRGMLRHF